MESQNQLIGGIFILFVLTLIVGLFGRKRKLGTIGIFAIGSGIGILVALVGGSSAGILVGLIAAIIALAVSPKKVNNLTNLNNLPGVADELNKLNDLKEKGIISEIEFAIQKDKLLKK